MKHKIISNLKYFFLKFVTLTNIILCTLLKSNPCVAKRFNYLRYQFSPTPFAKFSLLSVLTLYFSSCFPADWGAEGTGLHRRNGVQILRNMPCDSFPLFPFDFRENKMLPNCYYPSNLRATIIRDLLQILLINFCYFASNT